MSLFRQILFFCIVLPFGILSQKLDECEIRDFYEEKGDSVKNLLLGIKMKKPDSLKILSLEEIHNYHYNYFISFSKKDQIKNYTQKEEMYKSFLFGFGKGSKNIFIGIVGGPSVSKDEYLSLSSFAQFLRKTKNYVINKSTNNDFVKTYKDKNGLWWYYVEFISINNPSKVNYKIAKMYNKNLIMEIDIIDLEISEKIENYIEEIVIYRWNDSLKLVKRKNTCFYQDETD